MSLLLDGFPRVFRLVSTSGGLVRYTISRRRIRVRKKKASMSLDANPLFRRNYCCLARGPAFHTLRTAPGDRCTLLSSRLPRAAAPASEGTSLPCKGARADSGRRRRVQTAPTRPNDGHRHLLDARPGSPSQVRYSRFSLQQRVAAVSGRLRLASARVTNCR